MKMKKISQDYGARSYIKLVLNRLREIKGPTLFLYPFEDIALKKLLKEFRCGHKVNNF